MYRAEEGLALKTFHAIFVNKFMKEYKIGERITYKTDDGNHQSGTVTNITYIGNERLYVVNEGAYNTAVSPYKILTLINE